MSCRKCVKDPFEVQEGRCDFPHDATAEKGLISPGGENLLVLLELQQLLSSYDEGLRDCLVWPQERLVSMRVARALLGFLSCRCQVRSPHLEMSLEPEVSSPVLTRISGFLWNLHRGVRPHLEWRHACSLSSRAITAVSHFLSS